MSRSAVRGANIVIEAFEYDLIPKSGKPACYDPDKNVGERSITEQLWRPKYIDRLKVQTCEDIESWLRDQSIITTRCRHGEVISKSTDHVLENANHSPINTSWPSKCRRKFIGTQRQSQDGLCNKNTKSDSSRSTTTAHSSRVNHSTLKRKPIWQMQREISPIELTDKEVERWQ